MNIGFDAKRYFHNNTGLGNYSRDLVNNLVVQFPGNKYYLYDQDPSTLNLPANTIAAVPKGNTFMWRSYGIQQDIELHKLDIYHGLSNELPFGKWPEKTKKIVTIHDVIFRSFPKHYNLIDRAVYHKKTAHAIKIADQIIVTSHATANDLISIYSADANKINVVYQSCGEGHWKNYSAEGLNSFGFNKRLPPSFILYVSSFQTRKNHIQLLKAIKHTGKKDLRLVLAGRKGETLQECLTYIEQNDLYKQVLILNELQSAELPLLYRSASAFIYPSMVEGFGIPLLEAACAGLPMAVNDIPVFNEIAPADSLKFNANDIDQLAEVMINLEKQPKRDYGPYLDRFRPSFAASKVYEIYMK